MAKTDEAESTEEAKAQEIEHLKKRLDMFDHRLDNIDSMVTAVAERVMNQPVTFNAICPKCGQTIEIAIVGTAKPGR